MSTPHNISFTIQNKHMLDVKSKLVLKILIKECNNGTYKVIETSDIISAMPAKYRVDSDGLDNILIYLERQDCISIKYDDDGVYCLCVLPYGYEISEHENKKEKGGKSPRFFWIFFLSTVLAFVGAFVGSILAKLIQL